jgi:hypothetical protein
MPLHGRNLDVRIDRAIACFTGQAEFALVEKVAWIAPAADLVSLRLPASLLSLLTRYRFRRFEVGSVWMFSNLGDGAPDDFSNGPVQDRILADWLCREGWFQIGRPATGSYDPICVDCRSANSLGAVVQFDHEGILCQHATVDRTELNPSFLELLEAGNSRVGE